MAGRILALDVGDVRIGVAVSDPTGTIAQPLEVYRRVGYGPDSRYVAELCQRMGCESVLLGLPLNMDGSEGPQAQKVKDFGAVLEKAGLTVRYQDEREDRRRHVDKLAATVILEQWLASQGRRKEE